MKPILKWLLRRTGAYDLLWDDFCKEFPVRISGKTPELQQFMEANNKAFTDMIIYGMGCTQYVDPKDIGVKKDVVLH